MLQRHGTIALSPSRSAPSYIHTTPIRPYYPNLPLAPRIRSQHAFPLLKRHPYARDSTPSTTRDERTYARAPFPGLSLARVNREPRETYAATRQGLVISTLRRQRILSSVLGAR